MLRVWADLCGLHIGPWVCVFPVHMNEVCVVIVCCGDLQTRRLNSGFCVPSISEKADRESCVTYFCIVVWGRHFNECHFINVLQFKTSQLFCWLACFMRPLARFQEVSLLPVTPCYAYTCPLFSLSYNQAVCECGHVSVSGHKCMSVCICVSVWGCEWT